MIFIIEQLGRYLLGFFSSLVGYISVLYEYLITTFLYWIAWAVGSLQLSLSVLFYTPFYIADRVLYLIISALQNIFHGAVFSSLGISLDVLKNFLASIIVVAPNAKLLFYVLNADSLRNAITVYFIFLETWTSYRWIRVWLRG